MMGPILVMCANAVLPGVKRFFLRLSHICGLKTRARISQLQISEQLFSTVVKKINPFCD